MQGRARAPAHRVVQNHASLRMRALQSRVPEGCVHCALPGRLRCYHQQWRPGTQNPRGRTAQPLLRGETGPDNDARPVPLGRVGRRGAPLHGHFGSILSAAEVFVYRDQYTAICTQRALHKHPYTEISTQRSVHRGEDLEQYTDLYTDQCTNDQATMQAVS